MTRMVTLLFAVGMIVQVIKPLGLPGLRRRSDAWKLAIGAFVIIGLTALVRPE